MPPSHSTRRLAQEIGPTGLPFGCICDPYDDLGPARHDEGCPAIEREHDWMNRYRKLVPRLDALLAEVERQDTRYGRFHADVAGMRLATAALEDEADEVKGAWRAERKVDGWAETTAEAFQVAAVAFRLIRDAREEVR